MIESNLHTLVVGRTGSGKSTLVRALLLLTARAVIFDAKFERAYGTLPGARICTELDEAANAFMDMGRKEGYVVCRFREPSHYLLMLQICMEVQEAMQDYGPLVVVMEEASRYTDTYNIPEVVRQTYNAGRHARISLLTVIQMDTDIHRVTRANSEVIVTMAQNRLSTDMARYFDWETVSGLVSVKDDYTPTPIQNRHFATYPPDLDLYDVWQREHGYIMDKDESGFDKIEQAL